jgi:hypothetical protein
MILYRRQSSVSNLQSPISNAIMYYFNNTVLRLVIIFFFLSIIRSTGGIPFDKNNHPIFNLSELTKDTHLHKALTLLSRTSCNNSKEDDDTYSTPLDHQNEEKNLIKLTESIKIQSESLIKNAPHAMNYSIFQGNSSLRSLTTNQLHLLSFFMEKRRRKENNKHVHATNDGHSSRNNSRKLSLPTVLLILQNALDPAHELILGVTTENIHEAEYAATHPGETSWSIEHPSSTLDDILHYIIHRLEGCHESQEGGGRHIGYENAKYWLAGGDKKLDCVATHGLWTFLKDYVLMNEKKFNHLELIVPKAKRRTYSIIAEGGNMRNVHVDGGSWDEFRFIDLCQIRYEHNTNEDSLYESIDELQVVQLYFLLKHTIREEM